MNDVLLNYTEGTFCDTQLQRHQHDHDQVLKSEKRAQTQENCKRPKKEWALCCKENRERVAL